MILADSKVFITGADGFVGDALTGRLINEGARVFVNLLDTELTFPHYDSVERVFNVELTDYDRWVQVFSQVRPDVVYHLAAITQVKDAEFMPRQTMQVNVMGTVNIIEAIMKQRDTKPRIVVASSDKAYGEPTQEPLTIGARLDPVHPYDASKAAADLIAQSYARFYDWPIFVTRMANIYGPGDTNWQRLIPGVLRDILEERTPYIRSDGTPIREYLYIDDAVNAYMKLGEIEFREEEYGQVFNFAPETPYSVMQVVNEILRITRVNVDPNVTGESTTETHKITLADAFTRDRLTWAPQVRLEHGLAVTYQWVAEYIEDRRKAKRWHRLR